MNGQTWVSRVGSSSMNKSELIKRLAASHPDLLLRDVVRIDHRRGGEADGREPRHNQAAAEEPSRSGPSGALWPRSIDLVCAQGLTAESEGVLAVRAYGFEDHAEKQ